MPIIVRFWPPKGQTNGGFWLISPAGMAQNSHSEQILYRIERVMAKLSLAKAEWPPIAGLLGLPLIVGQRKAMAIAAESNPAGDRAKRRERSQTSECMFPPR